LYPSTGAPQSEERFHRTVDCGYVSLDAIAVGILTRSKKSETRSKKSEDRNSFSLASGFLLMMNNIHSN
jgi:hypothetical protein